MERLTASQILKELQRGLQPFPCSLDGVYVHNQQRWNELNFGDSYPPIKDKRGS